MAELPRTLGYKGIEPQNHIWQAVPAEIDYVFVT